MFQVKFLCLTRSEMTRYNYMVLVLRIVQIIVDSPVPEKELTHQFKKINKHWITGCNVQSMITAVLAGYHILRKYEETLCNRFYPV
jgi:hypothetical protein